jgi:drug/metabolite transporter (DMT)-like permease
LTSRSLSGYCVGPRCARWQGGAAALALAVLATSWGSIFVRMCASPPATIGLYRVGIAALLILPWALPARRGLPTARTVGAAAGAGVLLALHFATWIASLQFTTVAASVLLVSTQPIATAVLSWAALGERPGWRSWAGILLAIGGVGTITWGDFGAAPARLTGDLLALLGALFAAGYLVIGRAVRGGAGLPLYFLIVNGAAAAATAAGAVALGQPVVPVRRGDFLWLGLSAAVPHLLGHGAMNWAVRRLRAYVVNVAALGEPVLATVYAWLFFDETPPPVLYAGAVLIAAGVAVVLHDAARRAGDGRGL